MVFSLVKYSAVRVPCDVYTHSALCQCSRTYGFCNEGKLVWCLVAIVVGHPSFPLGHGGITTGHFHDGNISTDLAHRYNDLVLIIQIQYMKLLDDVVMAE